MNKPTMLTCILTENDCYKTGRKITPAGIVVHSTGANNPYVKRYVQPVASTPDGDALKALLGSNRYSNHWNQSSEAMGRQVCVHSFIGKLADGTPAIVQTLPWNHRGWHAGGSANNSYIGFEMCEDGLDDKAYLTSVYELAAQLCAWLCATYGIDVKNVIGHYEAHARGIASNHGDPRNWFKPNGLSMDGFRERVQQLLAGAEAEEPPVITVPSVPVDNDSHIWSSLLSLTGNPYGAAGLMGNLYAESTLRPNNLQNAYEKSLGMTDEQYTAAVDNGSYNNFVRDSAGYGLAQWTFWSRKEALLNYAHAAGKSIGDLDMQLDFLATEIVGYKAVMEKLKNAVTVREASDAVLTGYERQADQSEAAKERRAGFGQKYHDKYANVPVDEPSDNDVNEATGLGVGFIVEFTPTATVYTPGGKTIPAWVKGYYHRVTKNEYRGKERVINGATCVCLGEKRAKSVAASQPFEQGINTWVAVSNLRLVATEAEATDDSEGEGESGADSQNFTIYTVSANDTFWGISKRLLGSGARYTEIKALNGLTSNIISTGMTLKIPKG